MREKKIEDQWTILQGEVYGKNIMDAEIYKGVLDAFKKLLNKNIKIKIISHKTKYPYIGEKIDLRLSALTWSEDRILNKIQNINFSKSDIYFENTISEKINKIKN